MSRTTMRPLIGIAAAEWPAGERYTPSFYGARVSYMESIVAAGGVPVILPLTRNEECLREAFAHVSGVLLPGGEDVHPKYYNEPPHPLLGRPSDIRDEVEMLLARWCVSEDKPTLGICRGLQLLNVALGGSLHQDLESETGTTEHREMKDANPWTTPKHLLKLASTSVFRSILGADELLVNSLHHQGIKVLAPGLVASAFAPDGLIEAVEVPGKRFLIAVQCHPETLWQGTDPRWQALFKAFVDEARRGSVFPRTP